MWVISQSGRTTQAASRDRASRRTLLIRSRNNSKDNRTIGPAHSVNPAVVKLSRNAFVSGIALLCLGGIAWQTGWRGPASKCERIADAMRQEDWALAYDLLDLQNRLPYGDDKASFIAFAGKYVAPKTTRHNVQVSRIKSPVYGAPSWRISLRSDAVPKRELLGFVFQPIGTFYIGQIGGTPVASGWTYQGKLTDIFVFENVAKEWYPPPAWMAQFGSDGYEFSIYRFISRESESLSKMGVTIVGKPDPGAYSIGVSKFVPIKDVRQEMESFLHYARLLDRAK